MVERWSCSVAGDPRQDRILGPLGCVEFFPCVAYGFVAALLLILWAAPALAQVAPIPTELAVGLGAAVDREPNQTSFVLDVGLAWVYVRNQWIEPALQMGLGPTSDATVCQNPEGELARPETCTDGYLFAGLRLRPLRRSDRVYRPFVHLLVGAYWTGTGLKDPENLPGTTAFQVGGGLDIRSPSSIHGLRLSGDYRYVSGDENRRRQLQFVVSYFVGWRGDERPVSPQAGR